MVPFDTVREWLLDHGYRDLVPRRDAIDPDVLFYTFLKEGRTKIGVETVRHEVTEENFFNIKQLVVKK